MKNEPQLARPDTVQQRARKIGAMLPLLAMSGLLGASLSVPRIARASSGHNFLETIGISIAVGTVLGASTLPFYDQPGQHLENLAYGASVGAVTGVSILVYNWIAGPVRDEYGQSKSSEVDGFGLRSADNVQPLHHVRAGALGAPADTGPPIVRNDYVAPRSGFVYPPQFWTPVVSLNW